MNIKINKGIKENRYGRLFESNLDINQIKNILYSELSKIIDSAYDYRDGNYYLVKILNLFANSRNKKLKLIQLFIDYVEKYNIYNEKYEVYIDFYYTYGQIINYKGGNELWDKLIEDMMEIYDINDTNSLRKYLNYKICDYIDNLNDDDKNFKLAIYHNVYSGCKDYYKYNYVNDLDDMIDYIIDIIDEDADENIFEYLYKDEDKSKGELFIILNRDKSIIEILNNLSNVYYKYKAKDFIKFLLFEGLTYNILWYKDDDIKEVYEKLEKKNFVLD